MAMKLEIAKTATITDVARMAGVSIKTVSRVVNKEANVREDTRRRVEAAIEALHYRPDPYARSLAARRSHLIGLVYDNPSASYVIHIQYGALATSRAHGYDLVIHPCAYQDENLGAELTLMLRQTKVGGLILTPPLSDMSAVARLLDGMGTPFVRIAPADTAEAWRGVFTNDREACAEMTRYLIDLGHRRIGFVIGHPDHGAVGNRYLGYLDGLSSRGLKPDTRSIEQGDNSFESGEACARRLLGRKSRPTAVFASNDDMAAGVMKVAHEMGLGIPADLSVAGFDDIPLAHQIWPALTTIRQPIRTMGERAAERLLLQLRGERYPDEPEVIPSTLIVRESTGEARRPVEA